MKQGYRSLRDCVFHSPLGLSCLPSKTRQLANFYLPAQTGIEIECELTNHQIALEMIESIGLVESSHSMSEQRFRLHEGEVGMVELYKVCQILKKFYELNPFSGIHYHTSAPFITHQSGAHEEILYKKSYEWVLKELDQWGYKGRFNKRAIEVTKSHWVTLRADLNTIEYRIGEMSFDYEVLIKRIVHCHSITRRILQQYQKTHRPPSKKMGTRKSTLLNVLESVDY